MPCSILLLVLGTLMYIYTQSRAHVCLHKALPTAILTPFPCFPRATLPNYMSLFHLNPLIVEIRSTLSRYHRPIQDKKLGQHQVANPASVKTGVQGGIKRFPAAKAKSGFSEMK